MGNLQIFCSFHATKYVKKCQRLTLPWSRRFATAGASAKSVAVDLIGAGVSLMLNSFCGVSETPEHRAPKAAAATVNAKGKMPLETVAETDDRRGDIVATRCRLPPS
jgi:hypothetical protein